MATDNYGYGPILAVMNAYLSQYEPAQEPGEGVMLKTTEQIESEIQDMIEPEDGQVVQLMLEAGYTILYTPGGRHGWAMRYRR